MAELPEKCPVCGSVNPSEANFCNNCGNKLSSYRGDDYSEYLNSVHLRLMNKGFFLSDYTIDGFDVTVATKSRFEWLKLATQLNIFVITGSLDNISEKSIDKFSRLAYDYATKNNKGLPRGFQSGVASFALLVSNSVDEEAKKWVQQRPRKHYAAFEFPVIFDFRDRHLYYYKKNITWGSMYHGFFLSLILENFTELTADELSKLKISPEAMKRIREEKERKKKFHDMKENLKKMDIDPEYLYEKLLQYYGLIRSNPKQLLEIKITSTRKQGLTREEAIKHLALKEKIIDEE